MSHASLSPTTRLSGDDQEASGQASSPLADLRLPARGHVLAGKYRIEGILGRGGMGVVVAGHQLSLDRPVAIKFLRRFTTESHRQRFTREAMAVAKMTSEHAVRVFDAGEEDGIPFIVMERLMGHDLATELADAPLSVENTISYLLEGCEAIAEAHALGIVHRDIKPSNLFLADGPNGRKLLKVLDFGVSKLLPSTGGPDTGTSTADACLVGTPAYASPEQLISPSAVDERTDIWALGVVLYQCVSGSRPFGTRNLAQLGAAILATPPADFDRALGIPETLRSIIWRCLEKRPEDRFQSVEALASALRALERRPVKRRWPWATGVVAAAALAVGSASLLRPSGKPESAAARLPAAPGPSPSTLPTLSPASLPSPSAVPVSGPSSSAAKARPARVRPERPLPDVKPPVPAAPAVSASAQAPAAANTSQKASDAAASTPLYRR